MKIEYDKERQQHLKNNTEDKKIIVSLKEMTHNLWFLRWDVHFQSQSTLDLLKFFTVMVLIMDGDHALNLCDIFSYNRCSFDFWVPPSFPRMATSLWGVFTIPHKIPFHSSYVAISFVLCISEKKKKTKPTMQTAGTDGWNELAPH